MEDLVRIGAAASALGVSADTLRRWERDGRVEFVRRGGQRFLPAAALAELLRARASGSGAHSSARNRLSGVVVDVQVDGAERELGRGELARVAPAARRRLMNRGAEPVALIALGGAEPHQGRDGVAYESWEDTEGRSPQDIPMPPDLA